MGAIILINKRKMAKVLVLSPFLFIFAPEEQNDYA